MTKPLKFKNAEEFGKHFGLTDIEMFIAKEKLRVIKKLRKSREDKGITQAQLAKKVGTKQPAIARMECGEISEVSFDFLLRVAVTLETSITIKPPKNAA